jgi:hypothetical protein
MRELVKITHHPDLLKDTESGAVVSCDEAAYAEYINRRDRARQHTERVTKLEGELADVKTLLQEILQRLN